VSRNRRWLAAAAAGLLVACGDAEAPSPPPEPATPDTPSAPTPKRAPPSNESAASAERGAGDYATYCATCHGASGDADTPMAQALDPKPARHSDGTYMNGLSDDYLVRVIRDGGAAVGKSPLMASWGGTLNEGQIRDVVAYIRTLADPPYEP
jgi:mono/diheme cytochrome c family protein